MLLTTVGNGRLESPAQGNTQMRKNSSSKCLCTDRWLGMGGGEGEMRRVPAQGYWVKRKVKAQGDMPTQPDLSYIYVYLCLLILE